MRPHHFFLCELDLILVKGKQEPIRIFEPLEASLPGAAAYAEGYRAALAAYRARDFERARDGWAALDYPGIVDPMAQARNPDRIVTPNRIMSRCAAELLQTPPPAAWRGAWILG